MRWDRRRERAERLANPWHFAHLFDFDDDDDVASEMNLSAAHAAEPKSSFKLK